MRIVFATLLALCAAVSQARDGRRGLEILELSPNLYLLLYDGRPGVKMYASAINEANAFAKEKGGVAVPVVGRIATNWTRVFEYQFRVMSRDDALKANATMADAVIQVTGEGGCKPAAASTALLHDLHRVLMLAHLDPLARVPPESRPMELPPPPAHEMFTPPPAAPEPPAPPPAPPQ